MLNKQMSTWGHAVTGKIINARVVQYFHLPQSWIFSSNGMFYFSYTTAVFQQLQLFSLLMNDMFLLLTIYSYV